MNKYIGRIVGNTQKTITISGKRGEAFKVGDRVEIINKDKQKLIMNVRLTGGGKQKVVTIPQHLWDLFKKGTKVIITKI